MKFPALYLLGFALLARGAADSNDFFTPAHRLTGVGAARDEISDAVLAARANLMIQTQTFTIMREPQALAGARRVTSDAKLQSTIRSAAARSGFPAPLLEAIIYLESWGDPRAESPAGPKGIMQISEATARTMELKVAYATRYRVTKELVPVKSKSKKPKFKTVKRKTPYTVLVRDDRMNPARAIPAAANYLAGMEQKFGGQDWAIFAYHCGQGCVARMQETARGARGLPSGPMTVARAFFAASPAWNRDLYDALQRELARDYSPTYWFRVMRARQLLASYRESPTEFAALARQYKNEASSARAPHRLSVWLKGAAGGLPDCASIHAGLATGALANAMDNPRRFGYSLNTPEDSQGGTGCYNAASPAALGALTYIAFETRRLWGLLDPRGEKYQPLEVVSLALPEDYARRAGKREAPAHTTGQVFDIAYSALPPGELECLRFVLEDMGWDGYLGFVDEGSGSLHIGPSPSAREFFNSVFEEASAFQNGG
jgi:soluble lytic murein transglycosylase-like protein